MPGVAALTIFCGVLSKLADGEFLIPVWVGMRVIGVAAICCPAGVGALPVACSDLTVCAEGRWAEDEGAGTGLVMGFEILALTLGSPVFTSTSRYSAIDSSAN